MGSYLLKRLLWLGPVMLGVSLITFLMMDLSPGDPAEIILMKRDIEATPEALAEARSRLGLVGPVHYRYGTWLSRVVRGDLGFSFSSGEPVAREILSRLPATLELAVGGLVVMLLLALPLGILAALLARGIADHLSRLTALLGASIPSFYLGLLLICYIAVPSDALPVMGRGGLRHLLLPSLTLGFGLAATYARLLRASLLEVLQLEHVRAARARGLHEAVVVVSHALRNALIPLVTVLGLTMGGLLGGTLVVEQVFAWPGVGRLAVQSIFDRDIPVIQGYALLMALIYVAVNLAVDLLYRFLDPRVRLSRKEAG
jgi:peptide/nickel transport system permease protein